MRRGVAGAFALAAVLAFAALAGGGADAQTASPLISPARIHVETPIGQGEIVQLPSLAVTNRGDGAAQVRVDVTPGDEGTAVDPLWLGLSPDRFALGPGEGSVVGVWLEVPADALPGPYHARLRASFEAGRGTAETAVSVQAAVAADLRFTVEERNVTHLDALQSWWARYGVGAMLATGVGTMTFVFLHVTRRYEIRRKA